jgi:hypothetical protein
MTRQMIQFTDPQRKRLKREAKRLGISVAELVRRIVDQHLVMERQLHKAHDFDGFVEWVPS